MIASLILLASTPAPPSDAPLSCRRMTRPVAAGEILDAGNTEPVSCAGEEPAAMLRFDPVSGVVRARAAIAKGEMLGRILVGRRPEVLPGARVRVTARLGKVEISRTVTALQPARAGERFFAQSDEGRIFVAPPFREETP